MLTKIHNKHFSERLFYADNLPSGVGACHNGNIAAAYIANRDTACTFSYTYDAQNRLLSSVRLTENGTSNSELFTYDEVGNVLSLQRFSNNRKIDDLQYDYGNDGNQLLTITDNGQDADDYSTIEYHNAETQADTTMRYDANGNLVYDADRGISLIKYNILNLPDTIQFSNGCMIINLYDAAGRKYKSLSYTIPHTATSPQHEVTHLPYGIDTAWYCLKEYTGNIERIYTPLDTTTWIHNSTGYYADSTYYHYIKDHLGNICAVVNSIADTAVQSTLYYASGVPMSISSGREKQPYLYNCKEFVEAHGLNTYDYGFRGYYATTGRFTTIDPLAEQTPWQSPYSYAGNHFVNAIDWLGLGGIMSGYNYTEINNDGIVILHIDNEDNSVVYNGEVIGTELEGEDYIVGFRAYFRWHGLIRMFYNYTSGICVSPNTTLEDRVAKWLRAKNIDKKEEQLLEDERLLIQNLILFNPFIGIYNDINILVKGNNIYGQNADEVDKTFAIVSLLTLGTSKLAETRQVANGLEMIGYSSDVGAIVRGILIDYGIISPEDL